MAKQEVARLFVSIVTDDKKFKEGIKNVQTGVKNLGQSLKNVGGFIRSYVTLPLIGLSAAAFKTVEDINSGFHEFVKATGVTGKELQAFKQDFLDVLKSVEYSSHDVGVAMGELNTRLGFTGKALKENSILLLKFAEITNTDVREAARQVTRIMADWSIKSSEFSKVLDKLAKISQLTGISITQLGEKVVSYGVQLRYLGFSLDEALALLGKWEKEGVATEKILGVISRALGALSKKFKDPIQAFWSLTDRIKKAKTESEALRLAVEVLGTRAGPDFAKAVREGRFAIDDYVKALKNSQGTVVETEKNTSSLTDKIKELKNRIQVELYPAFSNLIATFESFIPVIVGLIDKLNVLLQKFTSLPAQTQQNIITAVLLASAFGFVANAVATVIGVLASLFRVLTSVFAILRGGLVVLRFINPVILAISAGVALLAVRFYQLRQAGKSFVDALLGAVSFFNLFSHAAALLRISLTYLFGDIQSKAKALQQFKKYIADVISYLKTFYDLVRKIAPFLPEWKTGKKAQVKPLGRATPLQTGGIVKKTTLALIAEKEPEAVIPLSKLSSLISAAKAPASVNVQISTTGGAERFVDITVKKSYLRWSR